MTQTLTRFEALKKVAEHFETQEAMASAFGVRQATISRWLNQSKQLPAEHVLLAERLTGVPRHHIRPDIYPIDLPPAPAWWVGYDPGSEDCSSIVSVSPRHKGNRTHVLDTSSLRRAAR